jgi:hypothetical protein
MSRPGTCSFMVRLGGIVVSAFLLLAGCRPATGATSSASIPPHDISGVWLGSTAVPPLEPVPPLTPKGQELFNAARPMWGPRAVPITQTTDPYVMCDPFGFPRVVLQETRGMEFIQAPKKMVQLQLFQRVWRDIWTDGRPLPADVGGTNPNSPDPRRYGYSIGRWADDTTLVVETTGAEETRFADQLGHPHGLHARIEERYRRIAPDQLEAVVTIDDPEMYRRPFVAIRQVFKRGTELDEQLCIPSENQEYLELTKRSGPPR